MVIKILSLFILVLAVACSTSSEEQSNSYDNVLNSNEEQIEDASLDDGEKSKVYDSQNASNQDDNSTYDSQENYEESDADDNYGNSDESANYESSNQEAIPQNELNSTNTYDNQVNLNGTEEADNTSTLNEVVNPYESENTNDTENLATFNGENSETINSVNETNENSFANAENASNLANSNNAISQSISNGSSVDFEQNNATNEAPTEDAYDVLPIFDQVVWIGHYINYKSAEVKIKILTKGTPSFEVFQEINKSEQPELVIRFFESNLRNKIKWDINSSEFFSPVAYIRPRVDETNGIVDVVLTLRDDVKPKFVSEQSNITLTFSIPKRYGGMVDTVATTESSDDEDAISLVGVDLTPNFDENSELPPSLSYLDSAASENLGDIDSNEDIGVSIDEVISKESDYDDQGLPADFGGDDSNGSDDQLMFLEPLRSFNFLSVAQDNITDDIDSNSGNGFSDLQQPSGLDNASEAYENSTYDGNSVKDVEPGFQAEENYSGSVLSLEFVDSELGLVLQTLQVETGNNFIIPSILRQTKVTVSFKNVPWDEALKAILEAYQLGMVRVGENIVRIDKISNLAQYITELEKIKEIEIKREPTKILIMRLNSSRAAELQPKLDQLLTKDKSLDDRINSSFDSRTNSVIVEAPERILSKVKNILKRLDLETPQVEIASRIVSVQKDNSSTFGIAWTGAFNFDPGRGLSFGSLNFPNSLASSFSVDPGVSNLATAGATRFKFGSINNFLDLDLFLKMEEKKGTANVIQSNKVIVLDGKPANILQGSTQYFRLPTAANGAEVTQLSSVDFNLELDVTPRISADGNVQMVLKITSDSPSDTTGAEAANKNTKSVTTEMMRKSGETGVIGGIYDTLKSTSTLGIPFFSDLPIVGALFRSTITKISQQEFLVMVTPRVLERSNYTVLESSDTSSASYESSEETYDNQTTADDNYSVPEENFENGGEDDFANTSDPQSENYDSENIASQQEEDINNSEAEGQTNNTTQGNQAENVNYQENSTNINQEGNSQLGEDNADTYNADASEEYDTLENTDNSASSEESNNIDEDDYDSE